MACDERLHFASLPIPCAVHVDARLRGELAVFWGGFPGSESRRDVQEILNIDHLGMGVFRNLKLVLEIVQERTLLR